jgi:hypothetical protein
MTPRIADDRHPAGTQYGEHQHGGTCRHPTGPADVIQQESEDGKDRQNDHPLPLVATDRSQKLHCHREASFTRTSVAARAANAASERLATVGNA